jgi:hypothetical protein
VALVALLQLPGELHTLGRDAALPELPTTVEVLCE